MIGMVGLEREGVPHLVFDAVVGRRCGDGKQVFAHRTGALVDGNLVVVEDYQHVDVAVGSLVHGFEGHAAADGTIADDRNMVALQIPLHLRGHGHTQHSRNGRGRVAGAESVVFAFLAARESADAAVAAVGAELIFAAGQDFVAVGLMPHVPDQTVVRGVENVVDSDGKLYHTQTGTEMAGMFGGLLDDKMPQLIAQLG